MGQNTEISPLSVVLTFEFRFSVFIFTSYTLFSLNSFIKCGDYTFT